MKRVDLFGSSGDEESNHAKSNEIKMLAEAKRQKLKNLEGLVKELPTDPVTLKVKPVEVAPIYVDSDSPTTSYEDLFEEEIKMVTMGPFDEADDVSEPLDEDQAFMKDFGNMLRKLDMSRSSIETAMMFTLDHYNRAEAISMMILRSIQSDKAGFPQIVARLYLVSDILYNSFSVYSKAEPLRHAIERNISDMIEVFVDLFNGISSRIRAEMIRKTVAELIDLWEKWTVLPKLLCQNLRFMFTAAYRDEVINPMVEDQHVHNECEDADGSPIDFSPLWNPLLINEDLDGTEIKV